MNNSPLQLKLLIVSLLFTAPVLQAAKPVSAVSILLAQAAPAQQTTAWREVVASPGGFSVLMPGEPTEIPNESPAGTPFHDLRFFFVTPTQSENTNAIIYSFGYGTEQSLPAQPTENQRDQYFNRFRDTLLAGEGARLLSEQSFSVDGHSGREIAVEQPGQPGQPTQVVRVRAYLVGQQVYLLQAITAPEKVHSSEAERFFNSFKRQPAP